MTAIGHPGRGRPARSKRARIAPSGPGTERYEVPSGPGASRTCTAIGHADPRLGREANASAGGGALGSAVGGDVTDAVGDDDGTERDGVGFGLGSGAHPTTRRPATSSAAARDRDECIRVPIVRHGTPMRIRSRNAATLHPASSTSPRRRAPLWRGGGRVLRRSLGRHDEPIVDYGPRNRPPPDPAQSGACGLLTMPSARHRPRPRARSV